MHNKMPAVRWVGGVEIELLAIATGARMGKFSTGPVVKKQISRTKSELTTNGYNYV